MEAGKHALCEKPLTVRVDEAEDMVTLARLHDRFLMEAMWTSCHPVVRSLVDGVAAARFGRPRQLHAELGFRVDEPPSSRLLDPSLGAGALLDMGIYPLTLAHLVLGEAESLTATADLSESRINLADFHHPTSATFTAYADDGSNDDVDLAVAEPIVGAEPVIGRGYGNEAVEVGRCVRAGLRESPLVPHSQTLLLMRQMEDLLAQVGVSY